MSIKLVVILCVVVYYACTFTLQQEFLQTALRGGSTESDETTPSLSVPSNKPTLHPIPSPITYPRASAWGAPSPRELALPSIPPLGSYSSPGLSRGNVVPGFGGWSFTTTLQEFSQLCEGEREGLRLERFLGSMSLFVFFTICVSKITSGQAPTVSSCYQTLSFHSCKLYTTLCVKF